MSDAAKGDRYANPLGLPSIDRPIDQGSLCACANGRFGASPSPYVPSFFASSCSIGSKARVYWLNPLVLRSDRSSEICFVAARKQELCVHLLLAAGFWQRVDFNDAHVPARTGAIRGKADERMEHWVVPSNAKSGRRLDLHSKWIYWRILSTQDMRAT